MFLASWVARPVRSAFGTALYDASQVDVKNEGPPTQMVYRVPSFLSVVIPLRATLARHRVQQVIHHLCRSGRGALDGVGIDFGGGGRIRMAQIARHRCQRNAIGDLQRGVCVPLRYNYDKPEKPRRIKA